MPNRIWLNCAIVNPDWSLPNFNCSAPPPAGFPFQLVTTSVAPPVQGSPLLLAKLNWLALPDRSIVALPASTKRPSCSTALPICSVCERVQVPGLLILFVPLESPLPPRPAQQAKQLVYDSPFIQRRHPQKPSRAHDAIWFHMRHGVFARNIFTWFVGLTPNISK